VWKRTAKGLVLSFHLAGINNQNFLMRDDQTGTFWQQISGRAISGPLAGSQLQLVYSDELTFGLWRNEELAGTVLKPVAKYSAGYETKDWDVRMSRVRTVIDFPHTALQSRDLVLGIEAPGISRAYPVARILSEKLIEDRLGSQPVLIVLGPDNKSIRVFKAPTYQGVATSEFYRTTGRVAPTIGPLATTTGGLFMDAATGSEWSFSGCAVSGKLRGTCLPTISAVKDYWFDWRNYHPETTIFRH
jgi:Protein of unknown function (DUF3179)